MNGGYGHMPGCLQERCGFSILIFHENGKKIIVIFHVLADVVFEESFHSLKERVHDVFREGFVQLNP